MNSPTLRAVRVPLLLTVAVLVAGCAHGPEVTVPTPPGTVPTPVPLSRGIDAHVRATGAGLSFPNNYLGLSVEANDLCTLANPSMRNRVVPLLHSLGRGTVRIGGRSADLATWAPSGAGSCGSPVTLTPALVSDVFDLAQAAHWDVSWELPLANYNPPVDAVEARAINRLGGKDLVGWSIGNEPNIYRGTFRSPLWAYANYINQWRAVRQAVIKAVPGSTFAGPDACCGLGDYIDSFAVDAGPVIKALSMHFYAGSGGADETDQYLLGPTPFLHLTTISTSAWSAAQGVGKPLYLTETNTFPEAGKWGVSNTYAATLWMVNLLFDARGQQITQTDVEQSRRALYDPIADSGQPSPVYDAMAFFRRLVPSGTRLLDAHVDLPADAAASIRAFALRSASGVLTFVVLNLTNRHEQVQVAGDTSSGSYTTYFLHAPSLRAGTSSIRLGGSALSATGRWLTPRPNACGLGDQPTAKVKLPPYSVGVVTFRQKKASPC